MKNKRMFSLISIFSKETFRNWMEVFFTLLLPILLLLLFGTIFGTEASSNNDEYQIAIVGDVDETITNLIPYQVVFLDDKNSITKALDQNQVDLGLIINDENKEITFVQKEPDMNDQSTIFIKLELQNILKKHYAGIKEDFINIEFIETSIGASPENSLDFIITGVIALSLLSGGMFSMINVFGRYKKYGLIKRFLASPVKPLEFTLSASISKLFLNLISMFIIIILGGVLFNLNFYFNWLSLFCVFISSSIGMMGLGVLLLLIFKDPAVTSEVATILYVAMTFFSGVYFPIEFLPKSIRWISNLLPVKYVTDLIRFSGNIKQITLNNFIVINLVLFISGSVLMFISSKVFLKEEK
ncbi:MAG: ABC transporter permease [Defluviitoga tunisiensis]